MALVEIARFADVTEAQVAATALRASGIPATVQNEHFGQFYYLLQQALGGFRLLVPEVDAEDARAFLHEVRARPREPTPPPRPTRKRLAAAVLGFLFGGV